jgi:methionine-gamma-lyase
MRAHEENALAVATFLDSHPAVTRVIHPGLPSHPQHELARRQMRNFSGMIAFQAADGEALAARMMKELQVIHYAVSLGHHRSLVYWLGTDAMMASTFALSGEALASYRRFAGDGIFRLSVGLEDPADLCDDLDAVLGR